MSVVGFHGPYVVRQGCEKVGWKSWKCKLLCLQTCSWACSLHTFMEMITWHICGNNNMEYLDCLRPFPRLDYDVREGQGAADWPTLTNSCYAPPSPPLPEMLFASPRTACVCTMCTFVMIRRGCVSSWNCIFNDNSMKTVGEAYFGTIYRNQRFAPFFFFTFVKNCTLVLPTWMQSLSSLSNT